MKYALCAHDVQIKVCGIHRLVDCNICRLRYLITTWVEKFYFERNRATPDNNQILLDFLIKRYSENDYAQGKEAIWVCFSDSPICRENNAIIIESAINFKT